MAAVILHVHAQGIQQVGHHGDEPALAAQTLHQVEDGVGPLGRQPPGKRGQVEAAGHRDHVVAGGAQGGAHRLGLHQDIGLVGGGARRDLVMQQRHAHVRDPP